MHIFYLCFVSSRPKGVRQVRRSVDENSSKPASKQPSAPRKSSAPRVSAGGGGKVIDSNRRGGAAGGAGARRGGGAPGVAAGGARKGVGKDKVCGVNTVVYCMSVLACSLFLNSLLLLNLLRKAPLYSI